MLLFIPLSSLTDGFRDVVFACTVVELRWPSPTMPIPAFSFLPFSHFRQGLPSYPTVTSLKSSLPALRCRTTLKKVTDAIFVHAFLNCTLYYSSSWFASHRFLAYYPKSPAFSLQNLLYMLASRLPSPSIQVTACCNLCDHFILMLPHWTCWNVVSTAS